MKNLELRNNVDGLIYECDDYWELMKHIIIEATNSFNNRLALKEYKKKFNMFIRQIGLLDEE